jgi:hypothetical protein
MECAGGEADIPLFFHANHDAGRRRGVMARHESDLRRHAARIDASEPVADGRIARFLYDSIQFDSTEGC